ncbi:MULTISPECIES: substrate-binding domain-containing protein [unclassified Chelatococcus]|uniref:sugar ABC transporter substrate-binding protein n=1 Tax=unclassified Chelatococcus TaxID=2638111 RepID=UPI001BCF33A0|nr:MULTISPECIES: substrate-binding domain-containing protein [unclassified Chelatococcus]CAH1648359.1 Monosaccharide ABC transporter substrate-binding protein (CUT2 family) [Hyphomicrobiales bacterium]MBS7741973.1 substrate-binding domain-containing protein [Chelatococcus sp. HY11]MBX3541229.1 substrate-binding domain-containing protein [Chelatococcus sp.]MCO5074878.1 substrate-binding domain-containing protein [Chelatococcus sp.]CAH1690859.1 Monosaccharide ABC transporter substrate-binding pr
MFGLKKLVISAAALLALGHGAKAFELGVIGFQFTSETHARVANAAAAAAKEKGWNVTLLNSEGALPKHAEQFDALIAKKVDAIIVAMGKPVEADAQFKAAKDAGIPVITVQSGVSPYALFDIQSNEYKIGAEAALYLLGQLGFQGNIVTARFDLNIASRIRGKILDVVLSENQGVKELGKFSMARTQSWRDDVRAGMQALLLQNQGKINGIWASFDGQAYIIDDLLQAQGVKKGDIPLISVDGGKETYERINDPQSTLVASVSIPFEEMGKQAVDAVQAIVVDKKPKETVTSGPYLFVDAVLVDKNNVKQFLK